MMKAGFQLFLLFALGLQTYAAEQPQIRSVAISGTNLSVRVTVPSGAQKLTLEGKAGLSRRTWEPRVVRRNPAEAEELMTLPLTRETELLRVKSEITGALPPEFFTGRSEFEESSRLAGGTTGGTTGSGMTGGWTGGGSGGGTTAGPTGVTTGGTGGAALMEADLWQIQGQKLYFYNQHRGLHQFDIANPRAPRLESTFGMTETGEQMFSPGGDVVLMIVSDCGGSPRVRAFDMSAQPRVLWEFQLPGTMYEARLFGSDLILAAPTYRESDPPGDLEYGTTLLCLDLSDPSTNRVKTTAFLPLWGTVSKADDRFVLVSGASRARDWLSEPSSIQLRIQGSSVSGETGADWIFVELDPGTNRYQIRNAENSVWFLPSAGTYEWNHLTLTLRSDTGITNELRFFYNSSYRFKGTFSSMDGTSGSYVGGFMSGAQPEWESLLTYISVESLHAGKPQPVELTIAGGPRTKSNFHEENGILTVISEDWRPDPGGGGRNWCFVETFSLADPVNPVRTGITNFAGGEEIFGVRFKGEKAYVMTTQTNDGVWLLDLKPQGAEVVGHLALPGRALFVQPLPGEKLLTMSGSDATARGIRVSLFDLSHLHAPVLLDSRVFESADPAPWAVRYDKPLAAWLPEAGLALVPIWNSEAVNEVQLLQVGETNLIVCGRIHRSVEPRSIAEFGDTLLSVSSLEVASVDITDRDQPRTTAEISLIRRIDELLQFGSNLVEIDYGDNLRAPEVRLAQGGMVTDRLVLSSNPVVRVERRGDLLFLAQSQIANSPAGVNEASNTLRLSIVELAKPLRLRGQVEFPGTPVTWQDTHDLLWPTEETLVWCVNRPRPVLEVPPDSGGATGSAGEWDGGGGIGAISTPPHGGRLGAPSWFILDVSDPDLPKFVSRAGIDPREKTNFSETFASTDFLYVSWLAQKVVVRPDRAIEIKEKTELAVVDLSTPSEPLVRAPLTIPANLVGLSRNGALLYTAGFDLLSNGVLSTNIFLTLLAYDDVAVHLVDRAEIPHLSSEFIKERNGNLYFLENRPLESVLINFSAGQIPVLRRDAILPLRTRGIARFWNMGEGFAFGNENEIRIISLADWSVSPALEISGLVRCRWWFNAGHLAPASNGFLMPLGYFEPQLLSWGDS